MEVGRGDEVCDHVANDDDKNCKIENVKIHQEDGFE